MDASRVLVFSGGTHHRGGGRGTTLLGPFEPGGDPAVVFALICFWLNAAKTMSRFWLALSLFDFSRQDTMHYSPRPLEYWSINAFLKRR